MKEIIGEVIRRLRKEAELSQEALVLRAGVSKNYLSEVERGLKLPSYITMRKLAYGLHLPLWKLVEQIEQRAWQLGNLPDARIRRPGRESTQKDRKNPIRIRSTDTEKMNWNREFDQIPQQSKDEALDKLLEVLHGNKGLLQKTSAEEFLTLLLVSQKQQE